MYSGGVITHFCIFKDVFKNAVTTHISAYLKTCSKIPLIFVSV